MPQNAPSGGHHEACVCFEARGRWKLIYKNVASSRATSSRACSWHLLSSQAWPPASESCLRERPRTWFSQQLVEDALGESRFSFTW